MGRAQLLEREPAEGVRLVALELLAAAQAAARRLSDADDAEALHDFRVAVRRLRSWLRSFAPEVNDTLRKRWRRQLRAVVAETGALRDAEVMRGLVRAEQDDLSPRHRRAAEWFLSRNAPEVGPDPRGVAAQAFARLTPHLADGLSRYQRRVGLSRRGRFGDAAAQALRSQAKVLSAALEAVTGPEDAERAHRARIEGKRLRYLLEPLRGATPLAEPAVESMRVLQDLLGDLHDVHVLTAQLADAIADAAAEGARAVHRALHAEGEDRARAVARRGPRPGLAALDRRIRERRDALFERLLRAWLRGGPEAKALQQGVEAVARSVEGSERARRRTRRAGPREGRASRSSG